MGTEMLAPRSGETTELQCVVVFVANSARLIYRQCCHLCNSAGTKTINRRNPTGGSTYPVSR